MSLSLSHTHTPSVQDLSKFNEMTVGLESYTVSTSSAESSRGTSDEGRKMAAQQVTRYKLQHIAYIHMHMHMHTHTCTHTCKYTYTYTYTYTYYIHTNIHIHTYGHIRLSSALAF